MITDKIQELKALRAKTAELEQKVASELSKSLAALPKQFGFESAEAFIDAVRAATGARRGKAPAPLGKGGKPRRTRAVITDATRAEVKKLVADGLTGAAIAGKLGISLPSVQNIKKALGLVKAKKGKK